ncbi:hypothetical protein HDU78_010631, partial [Chytriomyces hyalinus]
ESNYFRNLNDLYALFADHAQDPHASDLTLATLRLAVQRLSKAATFLVAPTQSNYRFIMKALLDDIDADEHATLPVSYWVAKISHVLGFPQPDPFAASLAQNRDESIRARRKLLKSVAPTPAPNRPAAQSRPAGQKRPAPSQPSGARRQSTVCDHCKKSTHDFRHHNAKNCKSSCTVAGCSKNAGCPAAPTS